MTALNVMITQLKTIFCLTDDEEKRMRQREIVLAENTKTTIQVIKIERLILI